MQVFTQMMTSATFFCSIGLIFLVGGLTTRCCKYFAKRLPLGEVIYTHFPGTNLKRSFLDKELMGLTVKSGCPSFLGGAWACFNSIIYRGEFWMSITYPKDLEDVPDLLREEFQLCGKKPANGNTMSALGDLLKSLTTMSNPPR